MSEENVEIVRDYVERWNRGDIDSVVDAVSADITIYPFREWPTAKIYRGREGWRALIDEWINAFDEIKWDIDRLVDAGDQVLSLVTMRGRIKGTEVPIAQQLGAVFSDFREDGKIGMAHFFMSWPEALEAAGLRE